MVLLFISLFIFDSTVKEICELKAWASLAYLLFFSHVFYLKTFSLLVIDLLRYRTTLQQGCMFDLRLKFR